MGLNFHHYDGLQPEMSAGMIKEHECMFVVRGLLQVGCSDNTYIMDCGRYMYTNTT